MAIEDLAEKMEGKGWLGVGLGAVVLAPLVIPAVSKKFRPAAKQAIKGYLALTDKTREWLAESGERWQDLMAEAKSEYEHGTETTEMMTLTAEDTAGPEAGHAEARQAEGETPGAEGEEEEHEERKSGRSRSKAETVESQAA